MKDCTLYKNNNDDIEAIAEFNRQRQFLERSIDGLKQTINTHKNDNESHYLIAEENLKLIEDMSAFRSEANMYLTKYNKLRYTTLNMYNRKLCVEK